MTELIITEKPSSAEKVAFALADGKPVKKKNKQCSYYELKHNVRLIEDGGSYVSNNINAFKICEVFEEMKFPSTK